MRSVRDRRFFLVILVALCSSNLLVIIPYGGAWFTDAGSGDGLALAGDGQVSDGGSLEELPPPHGNDRACLDASLGEPDEVYEDVEGPVPLYEKSG
jgi:hypothetical protein